MNTKDPNIANIKDFVKRWKNQGNEDQDCSKFWIEFAEKVLGHEHGYECFDFEKPVPVYVRTCKDDKIEGKKSTKRIDVFYLQTNCIIEQKSHDISLDEELEQSDGMVLDALGQARRYYDNLNKPEQGRYIIACNFGEFRIFDTHNKQGAPWIIKLEELPKKYKLFRKTMLDAADISSQRDEIQNKASQTASGIIKNIYLKLKSQYGPDNTIPQEILHELNVFCVRIVFCLYADGAGLFRSGLLAEFLDKYSAEDLQEKFGHLFYALKTFPPKREQTLDSLINEFPHVNGGLFKKEVKVPMISEEIRKELILSIDGTKTPDGEDFCWSDISPTNFGCIFESTLDPITRKNNGMHYTSPENIHRVIDPLFLDDKRNSFLNIMQIENEEEKITSLKKLQHDIATLKFLDPACGSGNFLTETFRSLRRLEMEIIKEIPNYGMEDAELRDEYGRFLRNPCLVSISQFYGIEINDFASQVALAALWIADCQMKTEAEEFFKTTFDILPLNSNSNIHNADALTYEWSDVIKPRNLNYIIGNPPFEGSTKGLSESEKAIREIGVHKAFSAIDKDGKPVWNNFKELDFVCCWYAKAADYMAGNKKIVSALVSTNSICQGQQVYLLWSPLLLHYKIHIHFAWRTFVWKNESSDRAHVHCVIVAFSPSNKHHKRIFVDGGQTIECDKINAYLMPEEELFIKSRTLPLSNVPKMSRGSQPNDNNNLILSPQEKDELIKKYPISEKWIHPFYMGTDFISKQPRYCLWMVNAEPSELANCHDILKRFEAVREYRLKSTKAATREKARIPMLFDEVKAVDSTYIAVPVVSSIERDYIPMGYLNKDNIAGNKLFQLPNAPLWLFGVLTSRIHMAWVKLTSGKMKSDYSYSNTIVYNNFPWPDNISDEDRNEIEKTAGNILIARDKYPQTSYEDLYRRTTMPADLLEAHKKNDRAVFHIYASWGIHEDMTDDDIALMLLRENNKIVNALEKKMKKNKRRTKKRTIGGKRSAK